MKLGFIGCGTMANAIIGGILAKGLLTESEIIGSAPSEAGRAKASESRIKVTADNKEVVKEADIIVLSIKPQMFDIVIPEIKDFVRDEQLIVSIAAGKTLSAIGEAFEKPEIGIVRVMPNTPAQVGEGMSAFCHNDNVTDEDISWVKKILGSFGMCEEVPESLFDVVTAVSGSSPAYVFMFIEALATAGVEGGMKWEQAYRFAAQSVLGSAKMVIDTGMHPAELRDMVCSPGGTTIEAVRVLEEKNLRAAVIDGAKACLEKSKSMK